MITFLVYARKESVFVNLAQKRTKLSLPTSFHTIVRLFLTINKPKLVTKNKVKSRCIFHLCFAFHTCHFHPGAPPFTNPQLLRQLEPMDLREPLRLLMPLPPSVKVLEFFRTLSILVGLWLLPLGSSDPPSGTPGAAWSIARAGELRPLEHFQASRGQWLLTQEVLKLLALRATQRHMVILGTRSLRAYVTIEPLF